MKGISTSPTPGSTPQSGSLDLEASLGKPSTETRLGRLYSQSPNNSSNANRTSGEPILAEAEKDDRFLVEWAPGDTTHPRNWSHSKKWYAVSLACFMEFGISFASSAYSSAEDGIAASFGVSQEVTLVGLTVFIAGLGLGAIVLAPMSEQFGRNATYFVSFVSAGPESTVQKPR